MKISELTLALSGIFLQSGLCLLLLIRGIPRPFRSFFAYSLFSVIASITAILVSSYSSIYFYFYWVSEIFYIVLGLAALHEVFYLVFKNFYKMRWFRFIFPTIGILMVLLAILRAAFTKSPTAESPIFEVIISMEIMLRLLQFGLLSLFFVLVWFFRMRLQQIPVGIALGFGIMAAGYLVIFL